GSVELIQRSLGRVRRISLRLEDDAGAVEGALSVESDDEIAFLAPGAEAGCIAGGFDDAGRAAKCAGYELDHGILKIETAARALLVVESLGLQPNERLADLLLETLLSLLLQLEC